MKAQSIEAQIDNLRAALDGKKVPGITVITLAQFEEYKKTCRRRNAKGARQ